MILKETYLGRVLGIYFGLWGGLSFPFFEVFGLRAGLSLAKMLRTGVHADLGSGSTHH